MLFFFLIRLLSPFRHLAVCIPTLVEINTLLYDENDDKCLLYDEYIIDIVEELFIASMVHLPRVINTGSDGEQAASFAQLKTFVLLLDKGNRMKITISNPNINEKLLLILLSMVELKLDNKLVETRGNNFNLNDMDVLNTMYLCHIKAPWKNYKNLRDDQFFMYVCEVCACLAKQDEISILALEYLNGILLNNTNYYNEALILIQLFLKNARDRTEFMRVTILENLLSDIHWKLATNSTESLQFGEDNDATYSNVHSNRQSGIQHNVNLKEIKNNILHTCLVIETIGCYAENMQQSYKMFLIKSIHHLIEKSTSAQYMIQAAAYKSLECVKSALGLQSISDLININADYISHAINISLVKPKSTKSALHTLINTLQLGSSETALHLDIENIVPVLIAESTKWSQSKNILSFLFVFKLILLRIQENQSKLNLEIVGDNKSSECNHPINIKHFDCWSQILNACMSEDTMHNESDSNQIDEDNSNNTVNDQSSQSIDIVVSILKHIIPYITSKNTDVRLNSSQCVCIGLDIIKNHEDQFLPLANQLWNTILQQCDQNYTNYTYFIGMITKLAPYTQRIGNKKTAR